MEKNIDEIIRKIVLNNGWLGGVYDYLDGDLMAIVNQPEKFESYTEFQGLKQLYQALQIFDGIFKYKSLLFFNDNQYGTFVYDICKADENPKHYIEHFSMWLMSEKEFKRYVKKLLTINNTSMEVIQLNFNEWLHLPKRYVNGRWVCPCWGDPCDEEGCDGSARTYNFNLKDCFRFVYKMYKYEKNQRR